jgi:2,5-diketo-D-gluconate reductase A
LQRLGLDPVDLYLIHQPLGDYCSAWRGIIVIPKSVRPERQRENIDIFDFELTNEQMTRIAGLDTGASLFFDHRDPAMVTSLNSRAD